ncbi:hypothetical protein KORDIASMS9_02459 [Kordia sp. SMS9]|uniref:hypothetical protein n=1 Tax=Kordia sp. SMS9 TaxID=2282170 RepID=UPI000E0DCB25|nr:hypothetical protein [Kordia sp. SMS9]AXG70220.1 hypothetical protein KORDIASMS9_02459 [Kordia sp. SMS9]
MITSELIHKGLFAMADSSQTENWFFGHWGAAIITTALFIDLNPLSEEAKNAAISRIDKILKSNEIIFKDEPTSKQTTESLQPLLDAIEININNLSSGAHGVIYGALALKAIDFLNYEIPNSYIGHICSVVKSAQNDGLLDRYWNISNYKETNISLSQIPTFNNVYEAALFCLKNQKNLKANQEINNKFHFFQGTKLHQITHSHALVLLHELGYKELAKKGIHSLRKQIAFGDLAPKGLKPHSLQKVYSPFQASFWETEANDIHFYKLAYPVFDLFRTLNIENNERLLEYINPHWELLAG